MISRFFTSSPSQTKKTGKILAEEILKSRPGGKTCLPARSAREARRAGRACVIGLVGDLGSGKTTFLQGFARGLGIKQKVLSPTFIIMRRFKNFYHIDCYRIQKSKELLDLGFGKIISNPKNIVVIEWADRVRKIMPREAIWINFEFINKGIRRIVLRYKHGR